MEETYLCIRPNAHTIGDGDGDGGGGGDVEVTEIDSALDPANPDQLDADSTVTKTDR